MPRMTKQEKRDAERAGISVERLDAAHAVLLACERAQSIAIDATARSFTITGVPRLLWADAVAGIAILRVRREQTDEHE